MAKLGESSKRNLILSVQERRVGFCGAETLGYLLMPALSPSYRVLTLPPQDTCSPHTGSSGQGDLDLGMF